MTNTYCPKSDEGVKSAVKPGALVVGFGKAAERVADKLRLALEGCVQVSDEYTMTDWEGSKVNHLVVVVECQPTNGDCCEAASKFMRQVRGSDGYSVYSNIIGRKVAVLGLGKMGKVAGASKVEENMLKRGGCKKLVPKVGRADLEPSDDLATLPWVKEVREALEATMDHPPPSEAAAKPAEDAKPTECCAPTTENKESDVPEPPAASGADVVSPPQAPPPPQPPSEDVLESEQTIGEGILVGIVVMVTAMALLRFVRA